MVMALGPCLCGDPYCPNCGGAGSWREDYDEKLFEAMAEATQDEYEFILSLVPSILGCTSALSKRIGDGFALARAEEELAGEVEAQERLRERILGGPRLHKIFDEE